MREFTEELIRKAASGDQNAITTLYELTYSSVYKTVKSMISDEDAVLDIVQDSYIKGFQSLDQLDVPENFRAWMKRIATNKAKDHLKKKKPILFTDMASEDGEEVDFLDERLDHYPELVMDRKETTRLMNEILGTLSEDQRLVIGMFYYEEMSVREIAEILGCSENTVKSRLNYGRKKVEVKVRELEKRGTKLYSLAPLPFLLSLFALEASAEEIPSGAVLEGITAQCAAMASASAGAKVASGTGVKASGIGAKAAAGAGAKALTTKIIAGVLAASVAGGGAMVALSSHNRENGQKPFDTETAPYTESAGPLETILPTEAAVPETTAAPLPVLTAEEAYQHITAEYQTVLGVDSGEFLDAPYNYFNGDHAAVAYYHMYHGDNFYYAYYDIDSNGTEELLIGTGSDDYIRIVDLYGFDGEKAVQLMDEPTLGDRSQLTVMEDGSLYVFGSNGAASGIHELFRINASGNGLDTLFSYSYDFMENYDGIYHGSDGSTITETDFYAMLETYTEATDISWQILGGEDPSSAESAYASLLEDYRAACSVDHEQWQNNMSAYEAAYRHLDADILLSYHLFGMDKLFVAYHDIDGNGTAELFIGMGTDAANAYPYAAYATNGSETVKICSVLSTVLADGTILESGNGGGIERVLQIGSDGFTLEEKTDTDIMQGSVVFDLDLSSHGGNVILNWEYLCG